METRETQPGSPPPPQREPEGESLGRYHLIERIGVGGTATVHRAWDAELKREVAIKILHLGSDTAVNRFLRESQVVARLSHPNIVAVYDSGCEGSFLYMVMELVRGLSLDRILLGPPRDRRWQLGLLGKVARAVDYAHEQGVIHRDLKPGNILVTEAGEPKVADFGLAHLIESKGTLTQSDAVIGTPLYMAPEQIEGRAREVTARTDVHALGAILYEVLTGRPPHLGDNTAQVYSKILNDDPAIPRRIDATIPADLQTIVLKALEKEPERRYATARAFAEDLRRFQDGEAIEARPPSVAYRLRKYLWARKAFFYSLAGMMLVIAILAAVFVPKWRAERNRRAEAEREVAAAEAHRRRREAAFQKLSSLWAAIVERKRELRLARIPPEEARRELESAVASVSDYVTEWPEEPQGYYVRARGRMYLGLFEEAHRDLVRALALQPEFRPGWSLLGMVRIDEYQQRIYASPDEAAARSRELGPILKEAHDCFGKGWQEGLERDEAERWGLAWTREDELARTLAQAFEIHYNRGDRAEASRLLRDAFGRYKAEEYAREIGAIETAGEERLRWLDEAVALGPGYAEAWFDRGSVKASLGDFDGAIANFDRAIAIKKDSAMFWNNRANAKQAKKDFDGAIADLDQALALDPKLAMAFHNRGVAKAAKRDFTGAIADFDAAIALRKDMARSWANRADAYSSLGKFKEAIADYTAAIERGVQSVEVYYNRGNAKSALKDFEGSIGDYSRAIELQPNLVIAWFNRAISRQNRGDREGALDDFDKVIELKKDLPDAYAARGTLKLNGGDGKGCLEDYRKALEVAPAVWPARKQLEAYLKAHDNP